MRTLEIQIVPQTG